MRISKRSTAFSRMERNSRHSDSSVYRYKCSRERAFDSSRDDVPPDNQFSIVVPWDNTTKTLNQVASRRIRPRVRRVRFRSQTREARALRRLDDCGGNGKKWPPARSAHRLEQVHQGLVRKVVWGGLVSGTHRANSNTEPRVLQHRVCVHHHAIFRSEVICQQVTPVTVLPKKDLLLEQAASGARIIHCEQVI
jgi:hypothetical protein